MRLWQLLFWLQFLATCTLLSAEAFFYPGFISRWLVIGVPHIVGTSLVLSLLLVGSKKVEFSLAELGLFLSLAVIAIAETIVMYHAEAVFHPNVVFSNIHLHPSVFRHIALYLWAVSVISLVTLRQHSGKLMVGLMPLYVWIALILLRFAYLETFITIGVEDGSVEWLTTVFFVITIPLAAANGLTFLKRKNIVAGFYAAMIIGLVFFIGEEIAWGQRLYDVAVPDFFQEHNLQNEITIHNLRPIQDHMFYFYALAGVWGSLGWLWWDGWLSKSLAKWFPIKGRVVPQFFLTSYFVPFLVYGFYRIFFDPVRYKTWEEVSELLFAAGMFLFCFYNWRQLKKKKSVLS